MAALYLPALQPIRKPTSQKTRKPSSLTPFASEKNTCHVSAVPVQCVLPRGTFVVSVVAKVFRIHLAIQLLFSSSYPLVLTYSLSRRREPFFGHESI